MNELEAYNIDGDLDSMQTQQPTQPDVEPEQEPEQAPEQEQEQTQEETQEQEPEQQKTDNLDEYGNEKPEPKTYTEDEVNERINKAVRERLDRFQRNNGLSEQQVQHAQENFQYNENAEGDWQQQLKSFIKDTYQEMTKEQQMQQQQQQEKAAMQQFEQKFHQGMSRFDDFRDVVGAQQITDAMTYGLRGINDPAAFIYAASKRQSQELERIAKMPDPYAQMIEMGKLEERMRASKKSTKAPKPVNRVEGDAQFASNKKVNSIDDLIAADDEKRMKRRMR